MLPFERTLLERYGISKKDIDTCAMYVAGNSDMSPLYYIEDSIANAPKKDKEILEGLIKRRAKQIQEFLNTSAP